MSQTKAQLLDGSVVSVAFSAGTAGAPSLTFTGDSNTGIYSPGADQVAISTGGSGRLFVDQLGRVGIGATSSGARFEVRGGSGPYMYIVDSGANGGAFVAEATNSIVNIGSTYLGTAAVPLAFVVGGSEKARLDTSGRLGVGTSSVTANLDLVGSTSTSANNTITDAAFRVRSSLSGTENFAIRHRGASAGISGLNSTCQLIGSGTNAIELYTVDATPVVFGTSATERVRIDSSGRVGIGTSSPSTTLSVAGGISGTAGANISGAGWGVLPYVANSLVIDNNAGEARFFATGANATTRGSFIFYNGETDGGAGAAMVIDSSSRVGIGSTSDPGSIGSRLWIDDTTNTYFTVNTTGSTNLSGIHFRNSNGNGEARLVNNTGGALTFYRTASVEAARIDTAGRLGIGNTVPGSFNSSANNLVVGTGSGNEGITIYGGSDSQSRIDFKDSADTAETGILYYSHASDAMIVHTNGTERARIDSSGRLLVGTSTSLLSYANLQILGGGAADSAGHICLANTSAAPPGNNNLGSIRFTNNAGGIGAIIGGETDGAWTAGSSFPSRLVFSTTASGAASPTERMRIQSDGIVRVDLGFAVIGTTNKMQIADSVGIQGADSLAFRTSDGAACLYVGRMTTTRSINARGTINASGADYAEYLIKDGDFAIAKGDICGITASGTLTNVFTDALTFVVKSTNPSIVGGDNWATESQLGVQPLPTDTQAFTEWSRKYEELRAAVDRVAFAGQVPVNVTGAITGQYIVPVDDNGGISGIAKDKADLTLVEYMQAVGKVVAIEDDGRARIIVKVA